MRTVKFLIEELSKFPGDAVCFAYEGEDVGIVIQKTETTPWRQQGFIRCSEGRDEGIETEIPDWVKKCYDS